MTQLAAPEQGARTVSVSKSWRPGLLLVLAGTFALYASNLNDWFWADDFWFMRAAETTMWDTWILQSFDFRNVKEPVPEFGDYRPLFLVIFKLQFQIFGLSAWAYHLVSLITHLVGTALLWFVAMRLMKLAWAASLTAAFFALHPAIIDDVVWISSANAPMATALALMSFLLFMKFADGERFHLWYYGASILSFVAAILILSAVVTIALVLPVWYFALHRGLWEIRSVRLWFPFVPIGLILVVQAVVNRSVRAHELGFVGKYEIGWHMVDNYVHFLGLSVFPFPHNVDTWFVLGIVVVMMIAVLLTQARKWVLVGFVVFWLLVALAPGASYTGGAALRRFYVAGPAWALTLSVVAVLLSELPLGVHLQNWARRLRWAAPYAAVIALLVAATLLSLVHREASKTFPLGPTTTTVSEESDLNRQFIAQLQDEHIELPSGGVLYVVGAPFNLIVFHDDALERLVELHYGEATVKSVPLRREPFFDEEEVRASLGPQDRIFEFRRGAP